LLPALLASPFGRFCGRARINSDSLREPTDDDIDLDSQTIRLRTDFSESGEPGAGSSAEPDNSPRADYPDIHPDSLRHLKRPFDEGKRAF
jgi:hypothetical protein